MTEKLTSNLKEGKKIDGYNIYGENFEEGRISRQEYFELMIEKGEKKRRLMRVSVYYGKSPYYKPWIELFDIQPEPFLENKEFAFFDSQVEDYLLDVFSRKLDKGGRIFIGYYKDKETRSLLSSGSPPPCTRLGFKLFERGFTWFKDWYFAEGFHEGGQKLQGEKAIDEGHRDKHLTTIKKEIKQFLDKEKREGEFKERAFERAGNILDRIN